MNKIYDALEYCLQAIEDGADMNSVLARFPDLADELRPILEASLAARDVNIPAPSVDAVRRGRAKLLQRAAELRERDAKAPSRPRVIPVFQRLAIAFTLAAIFLASGTGLVRASTSALPGENLYPVKRTWEGLRLLFMFDSRLREAMESEYEDERLEEVGELLAEGRHETIQFAGVLMDLNGTLYVSGIRVMIVQSTQLPADGVQNGAAVIVTGHTNAEGFVEAETIIVLPPGAIVPVGNPVEVEEETENTNSSGPGSGTGSGSSSDNEAGSSSGQSEPEVRSFRMEGVVQAVSNDTFAVNGQTVFFGSAKIEGTIAVGAHVEVEGYYAADGRFIVTKVKVENESSNENDHSGSNSNEDNSGSDSGNEDNNNDESHDEEENKNEDHSGSGGGGDENEGD